MAASLHVYNISGATVLELDGEGRKRLGRSNFGLALKEAIQTLKHGENSRCFGWRKTSKKNSLQLRPMLANIHVFTHRPEAQAAMIYLRLKLVAPVLLPQDRHTSFPPTIVLPW